jgi:hypothetical protein
MDAKNPRLGHQRHRYGMRQVVVVVKERGGRTKLMADTLWNALYSGFDLSRNRPRTLYSTENGIYTNGAEEFFSGMRGAEMAITTTSRARGIGSAAKETWLKAIPHLHQKTAFCQIGV